MAAAGNNWTSPLLRVCVWTSVTKRTQGFCNNLAHQLIARAKISSMFYCILAGGPRAHHTARANEALYDEARKTYLQTSSWVLVCTAGLVTLYAIFMSPCTVANKTNKNQPGAPIGPGTLGS